MTDYRTRQDGTDLVVPVVEVSGAGSSLVCPVCGASFDRDAWVDLGGFGDSRAGGSERYGCLNDCNGTITLLQ